MDLQLLISELSYKAIRSSGSGGQHVNKVSSKVELQFDVANSIHLSETQKELIISNLSSRLTNSHVLILQCGESRSQFKNKKIVTQRFLDTIEQALVIPKERIETTIPKAVVRKRLTNKKRNSEKKANRKKPDV
ncbi:alternative ribosome rescue aminoacyl-tRNA hydrolase ArfB [Lacinutrix salivirga]